MRNIRLTVAYDGTRYLGWQSQPCGPTIQAELQDAVRKLTGESVDVIGSGRTDSGVHALGQVANFITASTLPLERILLGLSYYVPPDIVIRDVAEAPAGFHAQFRARRKQYRYVLSDSPQSHPFLQHHVWFTRGNVDADAMHQAAQTLVGAHDFLCFETKGPNKATSVRRVYELTVRRQSGWSFWDAGTDRSSSHETVRRRRLGSDPSAPFVGIEITANGFLWNMVRSIAGTLVNVGLGKWSCDDVRRILESKDRRLAGETAPAHGLYLVRVEYDSADVDVI